ncbi:class C sortase [Atopobium fossor]|uniref:class C sortase n=1 Tax=Atopobium fossor TaxID=39487 RepID=UPI0003F53FC5|nr:class C sortase [Atopobium fossor]
MQEIDEIKDQYRKKKFGTRRVLRVFGVLLFLVGCSLFLYPFINEFFAQQAVKQEIAQAFAPNQSRDNAGNAQSFANIISQKRPKSGDASYEYLEKYNAQVRNGTAGAINDPWGMGPDNQEIDSLGFSGGVVGCLTIGRLNETIPLYLGAGSIQLSKGASVVAGTSAPLGGKGNNCVIAAHRGSWSGLPMFRDIEDLKKGDLLYIETPWDSLHYQVVEAKVISPDDVDSVRPQLERDLITLLTCHPYGHNYQRYLVYCERVEVSSEEVLLDNNGFRSLPELIQQATLPSKSVELTLERWVRVVVLLILLSLLIAGIVILIRMFIRFLHIFISKT